MRNFVAPNCGPTAFAIAVGAPVEKVMQAYADKFNKGPKWQGRSSIYDLVKLGPTFGVKIGTDRFKGTLKKFVEQEALAGRRYIVRVGNHIVCVADGKVQDNHGSDVLHKWSAKRVSHVFWIKQELKAAA